VVLGGGGGWGVFKWGGGGGGGGGVGVVFGKITTKGGYLWQGEDLRGRHDFDGAIPAEEISSCDCCTQFV